MLAKREVAETLEKVVVHGDLSKLSPAERVMYYRQVCESLGLNPLTRPFDYIVLNGRLTLYTRKDATDQLRRIHGISVQIVSREFVDALGLYIVTARATDATGRADEAVGAVYVQGLKGEALANAIMKAETKAKRRVTLSLVGLGWTDESEVDSIPGAQVVQVDMETGEIRGQAPSTRQEAPTERKRPDGAREVAAMLEHIGLKGDKEAARQLASVAVGKKVRSFGDLTPDEVGAVVSWIVDFTTSTPDLTPEERGQRIREFLATPQPQEATEAEEL
jgi:hypothetical protein